MAGINLPTLNDENTTTTSRPIPASMVPMRYKMKAEQEELRKAVANGERVSDVEMRLFIESQFTHHDTPNAKQHLEKYIQACVDDGSSRENVCYDLFLDFAKERRGMRNSASCVEYVIPYLRNSRNAVWLESIVDFYKKHNKKERVEGFCFTLYEIYSRGEGVTPDSTKAAEYLKEAILGNNSVERRDLLRKLYQKQSPERDEKTRICRAYEQVIADNIPESRTDYAEYLSTNGETLQAIHWYVADGKYRVAYHLVNIKSTRKLKEAIEEFSVEGAKDTSFAKSLRIMKNNFEGMQNIFHCTKESCSYGGLSLRYTIFSFLYAIYKTYSCSQVALATGIVLLMSTVGAGLFIPELQNRIPGVLLAIITVWTLCIFGVDLYRRNKYLSACNLWNKLEMHPALEKRAEIFSESAKISSKSQHGWAVVIPMMIGFMLFAGSVLMVMNPSMLDIGNMLHYEVAQNKMDTEATAEVNDKKIPVEDKTEEKKETSKPKSELSLAGVTVGDSLERMQSILGKSSHEKRDGVTYYQFANIEAGVEKGHVVFLRSKAKDVVTIRGIHPGSGLQEVLDAYGKGIKPFEFQGLLLYEYPFDTISGKKGMLRFAVKNNQVDHVSVRQLDEEQNATEGKIAVDVEKMFSGYWKAITERRYEDVYTYMTDKRKRQAGSIESFVSGHRNTIDVELIKYTPLSLSAEKVEIAYTVLAHDRPESIATRGVVVKVFEGKASIVLVNGRWMIDDMVSKMVDSRIE